MSLPRVEDFVDMNEYYKSLSSQAREEKTKVIDLLSDLSWEYQRMTSSGKETYNELCEIFNMPVMEEE